MDTLSPDLIDDVNTIGRIPIISNLLEVICQTTGMGFAAIARVTDSKWVACATRDELEFGLKPGGELKVETTLCHEVRQNLAIIAIDNVAEDSVYAQHHTPAIYGLQSYISVPIYKRSGAFFGTICAIDPKPAQVNNDKTIQMFTLFAELISFHLDAAENLTSTKKDLIEERKTSELREQFIAILGHDLKNPVNAVTLVAELFLNMPLDAETLNLAKIIRSSSYRMNGLIDNILDFANGRLGGGIHLIRNTNNDLENILKAVITELQLVWPATTIHSGFKLDAPVYCDSLRVAQLFSNLLGNALSHGKKDTPVEVLVTSNKETFTLLVSNEGAKIPEAIKDRLFQPFFRGETGSHKEGLGLGLFIAKQIADAHGGTLEVISSDIETTFIFSLPSRQILKYKDE